MKNFPSYFKEAYYRLEKERAITISGYVMLKQFTGVSIPKLEAFLKMNGEEEEAKSVEEIKREFVESGAFVIEER